MENLVAIAYKQGRVSEDTRNSFWKEIDSVKKNTNCQRITNSVYKVFNGDIELWKEILDKYTDYTDYEVFPIEFEPIKTEKITANKDLQALVPKNVDRYYHRTLVNGDKDIPTLKKAFNNRPEGYPQNTLLIGPTGGGKTHALKKVAEELEIPLIRVNLNRMTTIEDFVGQWVPSEESGFKWQDGVLTRLMKNGGVIMIDEINAAPPEILFVLHSVLDFREITLTQKDGEVIKAHPNFWVVGTMNPDYYGTERLNEALNDRFQVVLKYPYQRRIESKLVKNKNLLEAARKLRKMHKSPTEEIRTPISTRMLIQFEQNEEIYDRQLAIEMMVNKFDTEEQRAVKEVLDLHLTEEKQNKKEEKGGIE